MAYDLIKISALPAATPDESQDIVVGVGDYAKRINYGDVKADMVGISPTYTTDNEPYLMRQTAHTGVVGKCALNKLVGGSLGWNQLVENVATSTSAGVTFTNNGDGSWTITGQRTSDNTFKNITSASASVLRFFLNHVYYMAGGNSKVSVYITGNGSPATLVGVSTPSIRKLTTLGGATGTWARFQIMTADTLNETLTPQIIDLTVTFGSTIADYVYGLESATAGSGIAWLRKYIDLGTYHAYDAGSIQSVQATAHVTKDANDNVIGNYPLGSDTLRGIPQLVSNKLSYDGDEKYPDGTIKRKYGIVDLGSLTWTYQTTYAVPIFTAPISQLSSAVKPNTSNVMCGRYVGKYRFWTEAGNDKCVGFGSTGLNISDSAYTTAAAFKSAMSSVYLVYELATESTESGTAYQKIQTIDADGTESFTTSSPVPVGHETQTPDNILAALGWLGE